MASADIGRAAQGEDRCRTAGDKEMYESDFRPAVTGFLARPSTTGRGFPLFPALAGKVHRQLWRPTHATAIGLIWL
ncbi:MAG: hypothetical protein ACK8QZ_09740 [Anaerolineales bacterium]